MFYLDCGSVISDINMGQKPHWSIVELKWKVCKHFCPFIILGSFQYCWPHFPSDYLKSLGVGSAELLYVGSTLRRMSMTFKKLVTTSLKAWCVLLAATGSNCYTEQTGSAYFCCAASYPPKYWGRVEVEGSLSAIFNFQFFADKIYQIYLNLYSKLGRI